MSSISNLAERPVRAAERYRKSAENFIIHGKGVRGATMGEAEASVRVETASQSNR